MLHSLDASVFDGGSATLTQPGNAPRIQESTLDLKAPLLTRT